MCATPGEYVSAEPALVSGWLWALGTRHSSVSLFVVGSCPPPIRNIHSN